MVCVRNSVNISIPDGSWDVRSIKWTSIYPQPRRVTTRSESDSDAAHTVLFSHGGPVTTLRPGNTGDWIAKVRHLDFVL